MIALVRGSLLALSTLAVAATLLWWRQTFVIVVDNGYLSWTEAGVCLVRDNDICELAKKLCLGAHPRNFVAYATTAFWAAAVLTSMSLWAAGTRRTPAAVS